MARKITDIERDLKRLEEDDRYERSRGDIQTWKDFVRDKLFGGSFSGKQEAYSETLWGRAGIPLPPEQPPTIGDEEKILPPDIRFTPIRHGRGGFAGRTFPAFRNIGTGRFAPNPFGRGNLPAWLRLLL